MSIKRRVKTMNLRYRKVKQVRDTAPCPTPSLLLILDKSVRCFLNQFSFSCNTFNTFLKITHTVHTADIDLMCPNSSYQKMILV